MVRTITLRTLIQRLVSLFRFLLSFDEYKVKVSKLDDLLEGERLCYLHHTDNDEVIITGNGKNDGKKFECRKNSS